MAASMDKVGEPIVGPDRGDICNYMRRTVLKTYENIRGLSIKSAVEFKDIKFWDLVIITTADDEQSSAYRRQIAAKSKRNELPVDLPFRIYSDAPVNVKIGSGGSVLNALKQVHAEFGVALYDWRILLICAGGQSQRLPTASVLGKLFLPLPICDEDGRKAWCMLDLKLALYLPLLQRAAPGVFVTCSDDVETYFLPSNDDDGSDWTFSNSGFTALGHVSSIEIGMHHGVYVLESSNPFQDGCAGADVQMFSCRRVLQKPTFGLMTKANAVFLQAGKPSVCTDSVYFFDATVCKTFVDNEFLAQPASCEVDAYGDFLRPLGCDAKLADYVDDVNTVVTATSTLSATRRHLYDLLHQFPLHVVVPRRSHFYHIGTMVEFVENLCEPPPPPPLSAHFDNFFVELDCTGVTCSRINNCSVKEFSKRFPQVTVMNSLIGSQVRIGPRTVVECSEIGGVVEIGDHCIVSNCCVINETSGRPMNLPSNCCFHTIAVKVCEETGGGGEEENYVTIAFLLTDDLKKSLDSQWSNGVYMGVALADVYSTLDMVSERHASSKSLWSADIFPVAHTMKDSFKITLDFLVNGQQGCGSDVFARVSMNTALQHKDVDRMMAFQERLRATLYA